MDEYYLSKEDWETLVELGVGDKKDELVLKKIASSIKTSFTKKYVFGCVASTLLTLRSTGTIPRSILSHSTKPKILVKLPRSLQRVLLLTSKMRSRSVYYMLAQR